MYLTRRQFIKTAALTAAGIYAGTANPAQAARMGGSGSTGGGMGDGVSVIDPPVGATFKDPRVLANLSGAPGVVEVCLETKMAPVNINGTTATMMTYNGDFPGGTIVARSGDLLRINFRNSLPDSGETNILGHPMYASNLHTHGLHVSPTGMADNVMRVFNPGESGVYEYDLSLHPPGNLNLYHPHIHGTVAEQLWAGLSGGLVIADDTGVLSGYETHAMVIKDLDLAGSEPAPHDSVMDFIHGLEGNTVMINGQVNPRLTIRPGQVQRWRVLNGSNARFYRLSLENHTMYVAGTDGGLLDKPYPVSEVLISPGERVDLLIKADKARKSYRFLSLPYNRGGMSKVQTITLMTLAYEGQGARESLPGSIKTARRINPMISSHKTLYLSMGQGKGYVNGVAFVDHDHSYMLHSTVNTYETWEVINNSSMDHPFHQHTNSVQVQSINGGDARYAALYTSTPAWKDVVIIPKWGSATLLVPVMDYVSDHMAMPMIHCHIPEHEDIGMMAVWHIMEGMGM